MFFKSKKKQNTNNTHLKKDIKLQFARFTPNYVDKKISDTNIQQFIKPLTIKEKLMRVNPYQYFKNTKKQKQALKAQENAKKTRINYIRYYYNGREMFIPIDNISGRQKMAKYIDPSDENEISNVLREELRKTKPVVNSTYPLKSLRVLNTSKWMKSTSSKNTTNNSANISVVNSSVSNNQSPSQSQSKSKSKSKATRN